MRGSPQRHAGAVSTAEADELTQKFDFVESTWPESGFASVRQDLELTNLFALMRTLTLPDWAKGIVDDAAAMPVPHVPVPSEYPAFQTPWLKVGGQNWQITGGVTTDVDIPMAADRPDSATSASAADTALGPIDPMAEEPTAFVVADAADVAFETAQSAFAAQDYATAVIEAWTAFDLKPKSVDAAYLLLQSMLKLDTGNDPNALLEFAKTLDKALDASPDSWKLLWTRAYLFWTLSLDNGTDSDSLTKSAAQDLGRVIDLNPSFADAYAVRKNRTG